MLSKVSLLHSFHWSRGENAPTSGPASTKYLTAESFTGRKVAWRVEVGRRELREELSPWIFAGQRLLSGRFAQKLRQRYPAPAGFRGEMPFIFCGEAERCGGHDVLRMYYTSTLSNRIPWVGAAIFAEGSRAPAALEQTTKFQTVLLGP